MKRRKVPLLSTLSPEVQALAHAVLDGQPHPYRLAVATHTVQTPYGAFRICAACYAGCYRTYPGHLGATTPAGPCECEHDKHFGGPRAHA